MKYWFEKNYKALIIGAFLVPIITVAIVSISHVTKWYGLSNPISWAAYLSVGIEIAALSALAAISANMGKKVYFPFAIVTIIQFIGNIYFAYSYIDIASKEFNDWVGLVSPLVEFMGVDPTDFAGHKRFLAFFAGGMLPLISLSFLHMLVKFTEEDKAVEDAKHKSNNISNQTIDAKDIIGEVSRVRLTDEDLDILQNTLLKPVLPNENLVSIPKEYDVILDVPVNSQDIPEINNDDAVVFSPEEHIDVLISDSILTNDLQEDLINQTEEQIFSTMEPILANNFQEELEIVVEDIPQEELEVIEIIPETINMEPEIFNVKLDDEIIENVDKTQLEKLIEHFTPEPEVTPEELEQYQNEQDIEELTEDPIWDLNPESFGDNFDEIQQAPVIQKTNIEEIQAPVGNIILEDEINYSDTTNDIWKQFNIEQIDDVEDDELKKKY